MLYFTVALARAGKTTFCNRWVRGPFGPDSEGRPPDNVQFHYLKDEVHIVRPRVVINGDSFRKALHGREYEALAECMVFAAMDVAARALLQDGYDVMIDETATTPETIKRYLRIDIDAQPVFIDTPLEVCLQRAMDGKKEFLVEPIKRMHKQLCLLKQDWPHNFESWKEEVRSRFHQDCMNSH